MAGDAGERECWGWRATDGRDAGERKRTKLWGFDLWTTINIYVRLLQVKQLEKKNLFCFFDISQNCLDKFTHTSINFLSKANHPKKKNSSASAIWPEVKHRFILLSTFESNVEKGKLKI